MNIGQAGKVLGVRYSGKEEKPISSFLLESENIT